MNDQTPEREATCVAYEDRPGRTDRTPGDWPIPQSPFKNLDSLCTAMIRHTHKSWLVATGTYTGARGNGPCLFSNDEIVHVWRDASGGWHPEKKVGQNWLPDLDLLDALIEASKPQEFDAEPSCGNYTADEVAYMRHPD